MQTSKINKLCRILAHKAFSGSGLLDHFLMLLSFDFCKEKVMQKVKCPKHRNDFGVRCGGLEI
jgi:hypothetical protein